MNKDSTYLVIFPTFWEVPSFFPPTLGDLSFRMTKAGKVFMWKCGMGKKRLKESFSQVVERVKPDCIVLSGFCGGVGENVQPGDFFVAKRISYGEEFLQVDNEEKEKWVKCLEKISFPYHTGILITRKWWTVHWKRVNKVMAVDMEGFWIGKLAKEKNIPFVVVKIISDRVREKGKRFYLFSFLSQISEFLKYRRKNLSRLNRLLEEFFYG
ncbi:hypothetical protein J7K56_04225 [Candidatus Calescamantes bacterium]|nr:hypothetical protein [Candidatus Calescamantes bacterium]